MVVATDATATDPSPSSGPAGRTSLLSPAFPPSAPPPPPPLLCFFLFSSAPECLTPHPTRPLFPAPLPLPCAPRTILLPSPAAGWAHVLSTMALTRAQKLSAMMLINGSYFVIELVVGVTSGSLALAADAIHMLSDVLALAVALFAIRMARSSKVSPNVNTYGYQRAELLGALANAVFLLSLCLTIALDAAKRFIEPEEVEQPKLVLIVGAVGLALNVAGLALFADHGHSHGGHGHSHGHSHGHGHGHEHGHSDAEDDAHDHGDGHSHDGDHHDGDHQDGEHHHGDHADEADTTASQAARSRQRKNTMNMRAIFLHVLADALGSVAVVITALVLLITTDNGSSPATGFVRYVDPLASLAIVLLMLMHAVPLAKRSGGILLNGTPEGVNLRTLRERVTSIPGVISMHDLHVWSLSDTKLVASAHVNTAKDTQFAAVAPAIKRAFHLAGIHSTTIQPESEADEGETLVSDGEYDCMMRCSEESCEALACCVPLPPRLSSVDVSNGEEGQRGDGDGHAGSFCDVPPLAAMSAPQVVELASTTAVAPEGGAPRN